PRPSRPPRTYRAAPCSSLTPYDLAGRSPALRFLSLSAPRNSRDRQWGIYWTHEWRSILFLILTLDFPSILVLSGIVNACLIDPGGCDPGDPRPVGPVSPPSGRRGTLQS